MDALSFAKELIAFESTSVLSNIPIIEYVEIQLKQLGFETERVDYDDAKGVRKGNVVGRKGAGTGGVAFFGHTDVVPADAWFDARHGPYSPIVKDGRLYGRGACDMKGPLACMLAAAGSVAASDLNHPLYVVATADEETGYAGAAEVAARSALYRDIVDGGANGIIGEPTELDVVYAHKGVCGFVATAHGRAAHSSTNEGLNANLAMIPFLSEMKRIHDETESDPAWQCDEFDPPTMKWNIGINDHTHAINITAPQSVCTVYFRPMPGQDVGGLLDRVRQAADWQGLELDVVLQAEPLYADPKSEFVREVLELVDRTMPRTVAYGTDGAMLQEIKNLVVFGPGSIAQAHTRDEWISLEELTKGTAAFSKMISSWCT